MTVQTKKYFGEIGKSLIIVILTLIVTGVYSKYNSYATKDYVDRENKAQDNLNTEQHKSIISKLDDQATINKETAKLVLDLWKELYNGKKR
jgi:hypothetical protein